MTAGSLLGKDTNAVDPAVEYIGLKMKLGDNIASALDRIGLPSRRVEAWLGRPCHCKDRQERLNQLGQWAERVIKGRVEKAREFLAAIMSPVDEPPVEETAADDNP